MGYAKKILEEIGVGGERLEMFNLSAAMGPQFAEIVREMTDRIKKLGPSPLKIKDFETSLEQECSSISLQIGEKE